MPSLIKGLNLEVYMKQVNTWSAINNYIPPNSKYQDLIESLKVNKAIKNLPRFVDDCLLTVLQKVEDQTIEWVLEVLKIKYGISRIEQVEECIQHCLEFRENNYEEEDEFILAMKELDLQEKSWTSHTRIGCQSGCSWRQVKGKALKNSNIKLFKMSSNLEDMM